MDTPLSRNASQRAPSTDAHAARIDANRAGFNTIVVGERGHCVSSALDYASSLHWRMAPHSTSLQRIG